MAVGITSPQSKVASRGTTLTLSWTTQYPQSAYEILYRKSTETAWSTFGKVTSTAKSVSLDLTKFEDFQEYHYRVIAYSTNSASGNVTYNGSDTSAAYVLIIVPQSQIATFKAKSGSEMIEVPIYSTSTAKPDMRAKLQSGIGHIGLTNPGSPIATNMKVNTPSGLKCLSRATSTLSQSQTVSNAYAYMQLNTASYYQYYYYYTYKYSYASSYYRYVSYTYGYTDWDWDYYPYTTTEAYIIQPVTSYSYVYYYTPHFEYRYYYNMHWDMVDTYVVSYNANYSGITTHYYYDLSHRYYWYHQVTAYYRDYYYYYTYASVYRYYVTYSYNYKTEGKYAYYAKYTLTYKYV